MNVSRLSVTVPAPSSSGDAGEQVSSWLGLRWTVAVLLIKGRLSIYLCISDYWRSEKQNNKLNVEILSISDLFIAVWCLFFLRPKFLSQLFLSDRSWMQRFPLCCHRHGNEPAWETMLEPIRVQLRLLSPNRRKGTFNSSDSSGAGAGSTGHTG